MATPPIAAWRLHLLLAERNVEVAVPSGDVTVAVFRRLVCTHPQLRDRFIAGRSCRLIHAGRLLGDGAVGTTSENTLAQLGVRDGASIHVALTDRPADVAVTMPSAPGEGFQGGGSGAMASAFPRPLPVLEGFDRLALLGLEADDIAALRAEYGPEVTEAYSTLPALPGETDAHRQLRIEDEWLRTRPDDSEFNSNIRPVLEARRANALYGGAGDPWASQHGAAGLTAGEAARAGSGTIYHFLFGIAAGAWSGPFAFILLFMMSSPNVTLRFKLGLVTGIVLNLVLALGAEKEAEAGGGGGSGSGGGGDGLPYIPIDVDSLERRR